MSREDIERLAVLADDIGDAIDEYMATGRGRSKAVKLLLRIQHRAAELARLLEEVS